MNEKDRSMSKNRLGQRLLVLLLSAVLLVSNGWGQEPPSNPKPVPRMQVIPMPYNQASFQRDGLELTRYHFGPGLHRPFLFPIIGPSGISLTRMGHPHDPESHSHHNSVWISHNIVNETDFWSDRGKGTIRHKRIVELQDADEYAYLIAENEWVTSEGKVLMLETRRITVLPLADSEWLLTIDMEFKAINQAVTLGKTPFGMIGVRMAKTIGVNDGGGTIRNSEGGVNEKEVLWKQARWVDYSGAVTNSKVEGITLFDHPGNPNHPAYFHVRNDGWMGASLTFDRPREIGLTKALSLRYGLYVHSSLKTSEAIETQWKRFAFIETTSGLRPGPLKSDLNLARKARIIATSTHSGYVAEAIIDGVVGGYPEGTSAEWASNGEKTSAAIRLDWDQPQTIDRIWLFDRPNIHADQITAGQILFSDGATITVGELPDDASAAKEIAFAPKKITWLKFVVTSVKPATQNIGLAEIAVFAPEQR